MKKNWKEGFWLLDGAMGTMLQQRGLQAGERPEIFALTHPEVVEEVHRSYIESGSRIIYANTFGANAHKLAGTGHTAAEVVAHSVQVARRAAQGTDTLVALDIGPIGELLEPTGTLPFDQAYDIFREMVQAGAAAGADLVVLETMSDLYEVKAGVLAARENSDLPVFVTMTFEKSRRTFTGCSIPAMATLLTSMGVDAIGINCSLGPKEIYPLAEEMAQWTHLPLIIKANAGLPDPVHGTYDIGSEEFAAQMVRYAELGVSIVGGCCGTSPEYIAAIARTLQGLQPAPRPESYRNGVCTPSKVEEFAGVKVVGERINPTGRKALREALLEGDMDYLLDEAMDQADSGAHILDVNVGVPGAEEPALMKQAVQEIQAVCQIPLQLDSTDPAALEAGLRVYNGKPLLNSVNGEKSVLERVLPLARKYGAAVVGLTMDEAGIPIKAEDRLAIARRIVEAAQEYGIRREDVVIDCLTLTASAQQEGAWETLRAVELVHRELGVRTMLGVSNISFGLPQRSLLNRSFLLMALQQGLDLPILNPGDSEMMDTIAAFRVLSGQDLGCGEYLARFGGSLPSQSGEPTLEDVILKGLREEAVRLTQRLLESHKPLDIVSGQLIPALDKVGELYEKEKIFLPQLLHAAAAAGDAVALLRERIAAEGDAQLTKGKVLLATVQGDVHDIGKNIAKALLESYGYQVVDLGRDVPPQKIVEEVKAQNIRLVGLSALMTTTVRSMKKTVELLRQSGHSCKIYVGGAVLTPESAEELGADYYARDAKRSVEIAREVLG
ncbi:MAG: homocysteine S-methyltransferase family protein [Eubacteriales bacterium]|jgi:5-methyltetrahydrofolate--homocysteine methyltransferase